jgi:uncharacterized Zn-finger protein
MYQCQYEGCSKSFPNQSLFIRHMRTHNGDKPYMCNICHRSFSLQVKYSSICEYIDEILSLADTCTLTGKLEQTHEDASD